MGKLAAGLTLPLGANVSASASISLENYTRPLGLTQAKMFRTRLFQLLLLVVAFALVTEGVVPRNKNGAAVEVRQVEDPGEISLPVENLPTGDSTSETDPATSTEPGQTEESTTTEADPTSTEATETSEPPQTTTTPPDEGSETTSAPESTTAPSSTEEETTTTESNEDSTTSTTTTEEGPRSTTTEEESQDTTTQEPITSTRIEVITKTNSGGEVELSTSTSVTTETPDLNEGDNGGGGGLSPETRNIVIGVVVGVGGAIILGALGIVAWRIRARKKLAEENDGLMEYNGGYTAVDKTEPSVPGSSPSNAPTSSTRSPFQSTLENYHQPTQPVNASSNF